MWLSCTSTGGVRWLLSRTADPDFHCLVGVGMVWSEILTKWWQFETLILVSKAVISIFRPRFVARTVEMPPPLTVWSPYCHAPLVVLSRSYRRAAVTKS